uniref:Uncharacterized protein n=1 Tax=Oncorhynchus tshawytscha TaxID=74940 RepID=A0A8C8BW13_ONCTS
MSPRKKLVPVSRRRMAKAGDDFFPFNLLPVECQLPVLSFLRLTSAILRLYASVGVALCDQGSFGEWQTFLTMECSTLDRKDCWCPTESFELWKAWFHHYTHHLISCGASLLTLKASFDLGDQCNKWGELLSDLLKNMRLHFDWSETSVSLLTQFQHLRVLELKYFWVFKGRSPSTLQILTKSLPNLKSLTFRGLVFSSLNLPALRELRAKNIARGITLRQNRLRIQSRWRLYQVLREGTTKRQALNNDSRELSSILQQSCYCLQHLDSWLW